MYNLGGQFASALIALLRYWLLQQKTIRYRPCWSRAKQSRLPFKGLRKTWSWLTRYCLLVGMSILRPSTEPWIKWPISKSSLTCNLPPHPIIISRFLQTRLSVATLNDCMYDGSTSLCFNCSLYVNSSDVIIIVSRETLVSRLVSRPRDKRCGWTLNYANMTERLQSVPVCLVSARMSWRVCIIYGAYPLQTLVSLVELDT